MKVFRIQLHPNNIEGFSVKDVKEILKRGVIGLDVWDVIAEELGIYDKPLTEWSDEDFRKYDELSTEKRKETNPNASRSTFAEHIRGEFLRMEEGDIVLVHHGGTPVALVKITGSYFMEPETDEIVWFRHRYPIEILGWYEDYKDVLPEIRIPASGTIQELVDPNSKTYNFIMRWYQEVLNARKFRGED